MTLQVSGVGSQEIEFSVIRGFNDFRASGFVSGLLAEIGCLTVLVVMEAGSLKST